MKDGQHPATARAQTGASLPSQIARLRDRFVGAVPPVGRDRRLTVEPIDAVERLVLD